uniref:UPF0352 protein PSHAa1818 n=1 Tax=Anthurium amnicola TaxID=1678845 RepID=A0A1D1XWJ8_9ARAE
MAKRCFGCTIEAEPRTLRRGQLVTAREAAKDIVENKEAEEASTVFSEGRRPVVSIKTMEKQIERIDQLHDLVGINNMPTVVNNGSWNLSRTHFLFEEFPDGTKITEPFSAPLEKHLSEAQSQQ